MIRRAALLGALALAWVAGPAAAEERIRSFETAIALERDGSFSIEERIVYDFGQAKRHGIYRDIPVRYGRGRAADYRIALDVSSVKDAEGRDRPYELSNEGVHRRIRIGDPRRVVSGVQEYRIRYGVRRGILWFDAHDELYWNATGNAWQVPIDAVRARVSLPPGAGSLDVEAACFTGPQGSVRSECEALRSGDRVDVSARSGFRPREGLTLVVGLPKGVLREPGALAKLLDRASDYVSGATALPLLVILAMTGVWWRSGRDPGGPVAIPVRYEPPEGMTPAEMGTVLDERVDIGDVTATLLDLAVRGYLEISEIESKKFLFLSDTDYEIRRVRPADASLKLHEQRVLDALLEGRESVTVSELRNEFYESLPGIRDALYEEVSRRGKWFPRRPDSLRTLGTSLGAAVAIAGAGLSWGVFANQALGFVWIATGAVVALLGRHLPRKTRRGRRARQHIRGFQEFVERVEVDRLERLGLRTVSQFERLLPYAFVLGAADAWADAFADLYTRPPDWYHSRRGGPFRARYFVSDVGRSLQSAGSAMSSRPRSSGSGSSGFGGGGFSGGGFGGGGGGSW
jgi:uncharacterized membrane protein YgcG